DALIVNPGAWSHYSWALRDALEPFSGPVVEVHISDVDAREEWRRLSVLEGLTDERITGEGINGYRRALEALAKRRDG
ncbi:type II 3-dehydroquinate dehydratase, partial [Gaiella sp.]|uniref:type II 3-dehydroquinate dehydratase n=1 Tax=Gaiella sp. TaxID=2663207 RepID=UPI002C72D403